MKTIIDYFRHSAFVILILTFSSATASGQDQVTAPAAAQQQQARQQKQDILGSGTLTEQMQNLEDRTRIYDNFRAVREDVFQKLVRNVSDSLTLLQNSIGTLKTTISEQAKSIDSLKAYLASTEAGLNEMTRTKNRLRFFGIEINKTVYNTIVTVVIAGLITLLVMGFLVFKRNIAVTAQARKEHLDLRNEFETYRKSAREAREKMSMDHFNEIRKLKGG
ncbi:MAG: hypothetical protein MUD02_07055 [Bacteroidales bacterium]|jgi:hypothetical protein|nr:hypothetical protein [Bacteroidales bacterium]MCU0408690.1 hypothetical protein [Bacteroidales bacterium]